MKRHARASATALTLSLASCALISAGCSGDADRLASLGTRLGEKIKGVSLPRGMSLTDGWPILPLGDPPLSLRVSARLGWDRELAGTAIRVQTTGEVVELSGNVDSLDQKQKAVKLAETTTGVGKVVDRLEVGQDP